MNWQVGEIKAYPNGLNTADFWSEILDEGEEIIWQGRPTKPIRDSSAYGPSTILTGIIFAAAGAFMAYMMLISGEGPWFVGLLFLCVGIGMSYIALAWPTKRMQHTYYSLSNKTAYIATDDPFQGKRLRHIDIVPHLSVEFREGSPSDVILGDPEWTPVKLNNRRIYRKVGFHNIEEGETVLNLIHEIKEKAAS